MTFLIARLESESDQVKMWAAYHLVDRWQEEREQFIEQLWRSPLPETRKSAINLIGKHRIERYSFPLLRVFTANEAGLRASAGIALGRLGTMEEVAKTAVFLVSDDASYITGQVISIEGGISMWQGPIR